MSEFSLLVASLLMCSLWTPFVHFSSPSWCLGSWKLTQAEVPSWEVWIAMSKFWYLIRSKIKKILCPPLKFLIDCLHFSDLRNQSLWAFCPPALCCRLTALLCQQSTCHTSPCALQSYCVFLGHTPWGTVLPSGSLLGQWYFPARLQADK